MKKVIAITLLLMMVLTGCRVQLAIEPSDTSGQFVDVGEDSEISNGQDVDELAFDGKIVIITNWFEVNEEAYLVAKTFSERFGEDRVIHKIWPGSGSEFIINDTLQEVSDDPEVVALVLNNSWMSNKHVIDALENLRDDIFVVYASVLHQSCTAQRYDVDPRIKADLIIQTNMQRFGELYVAQAISMGVDTIAYYTFPRLNAMPSFAMRREAMRNTAELEGIKFIEIDSVDPIEDLWHTNVPLFITQDIPRQVESLGENTAFFGSSCGFDGVQNHMSSQVIATGAVFINTCCPSPYRYYPESIGIEIEVPTGENDEDGKEINRRLELPELLQALDEAVDAAGISGRISSWTVSDSMMWTTIGFMYAVEWLNGNVPQQHGVIDIEVLRRLASDYATELGVDAEVILDALFQEGQLFPHYIQGVISYHVFG